MKIKVLGCSGGDLPGYSPVSFLINEAIVLDAGSITSKLTMKDQLKIKHILISHGHLDHIKDLCFLSDNLFLSGSTRPITIHSSEAILTDIKKNIFNGIIWPDATKIPSPERPLYFLRSIKDTLNLEGISIKALPVNHSHAALGYVISNKKSTIVFTGDTGPTEELWKTVNEEKNLKAIFIETSFPAQLQDLAWQSRHLSVTSLLREIPKIQNPKIPLYLYHLKPVYVSQITEEIKKLKNPRLHILKPNTTLSF